MDNLTQVINGEDDQEIYSDRRWEHPIFDLGYVEKFDEDEHDGV